MYPFGLYASDVYYGPCMYIQDVDVSVVDMMRCMILSVHFSVILSLLMYIFLFTVLSGWHVLLFC